MDHKPYYSTKDCDDKKVKSNKVEEYSDPNKGKWFILRDDVKWSTVVVQLLLQSYWLYGILIFPYIEHYKTTIWTFVCYWCAMFGTTAGVHRLWTHRTYEAIWPYRAVMAIFFFISAQLPIRKWVLLHRTHHIHSDTDGDPYNSSAGFFYSHLGWYLTKRPDIVHKNSLKINMSDIDADPVVKFCEKHYVLLCLLASFVIPVAVPVYFWNENLYYSMMAANIRFVTLIHSVGAVNSFAHMVGYRPYDRNSPPTNNIFVAALTHGEGWHNFHHAFPYDYRSSEFGSPQFDITGTIIRKLEKIGIIYNLKTAPDSLINLIANRRGDGSRRLMQEKAF